VTGPTTRIVVVDDHNLFRAGLIELLDSVSEYEITADGATGVEAITLAHEHKPDIVVLDIEMPGPGASATIRKILEASPHTKIVILTMHDDPDLVRGLLDAGATSYLLKSAGRAELIAAINAACRSEDAVLVSVSRRTLMGLGRAAAKPANSALFSRREIEVVQRLAEGGSNRNIAAALYISEATVKRHLANIYAKLDATSRIDAIRKAAQLGIISNTLTGDTPGHGATD
jgi:DNA-binding NarL/FixJ family response regulator